MKHMLWLALLWLCIPARAQTVAQDIKAGERQIQLRQMQAAKRLFDRALRSDPTSFEAIRGHGYATHCLGDIKGAIADYSKALDAQPFDPYARIWRANGYVQLSRNAEAVSDYSVALSWKGKLPADVRYVALAWRGANRYRLGQTAEARADVDAALKLNPKRPEAWAASAFIRRAAGDLAGAQADEARMNAISPGFLESLEAGGGPPPEAAGSGLGVMLLGIFTAFLICLALAIRRFVPEMRADPENPFARGS